MVSRNRIFTKWRHSKWPTRSQNLVEVLGLGLGLGLQGLYSATNCADNILGRLSVSRLDEMISYYSIAYKQNTYIFPDLM